jgi:hypothetical protein
LRHEGEENYVAKIKIPPISERSPAYQPWVGDKESASCGTLICNTAYRQSLTSMIPYKNLTGFSHVKRFRDLAKRGTPLPIILLPKSRASQQNIIVRVITLTSDVLPQFHPLTCPCAALYSL